MDHARRSSRLAVLRKAQLVVLKSHLDLILGNQNLHFASPAIIICFYSFILSCPNNLQEELKLIIKNKAF